MNTTLKVNHLWSVLCRKAIVDRASNNVSLLESFEQLTVSIGHQPKELVATGSPITIPQSHELVTLWSRNDIDQEYSRNVELEFVDPEGNVLSQSEYILKFGPHIRRARVITTIGELSLTKSGIYTYRLYLQSDSGGREEPVVELPLEVKIEYGVTAK